MSEANAADTKVRQSSYPMISVDQALAIVMCETCPLDVELVDTLASCGRVVAEQVKAVDPFPSFRASIMDGYAVHAPLTSNTCRKVQNSVLAGDLANEAFDSNFVTYITTGARVPDGVSTQFSVVFCVVLYC